jgi:NADPH:quinone reductase-like Zn-dependent oxidoreductase
VPLAALTALQGLRDRGHIQAGQRVLINGASGGVGTFAVQIAKAFDTEVTAVCSTRNLDLVRSIGADFAIDYTRTDFTRESKKYDLVFDMVGNRSVGDLRRALTTEGTCAIGGFTSLRRMFGHLIGGSVLTAITRQDIGMMNTARSNQDDLLFIRGLIESAKIMPVIDRCYSLSEIPEAIRYLETSRARGKVIIKVR